MDYWTAWFVWPERWFRAVGALVLRFHVADTYVHGLPAPVGGRAISVLPETTFLAGAIVATLLIVSRSVEAVVAREPAISARERLASRLAFNICQEIGL